MQCFIINYAVIHVCKTCGFQVSNINKDIQTLLPIGIRLKCYYCELCIFKNSPIRVTRRNSLLELIQLITLNYDVYTKLHLFIPMINLFNFRIWIGVLVSLFNSECSRCLFVIQILIFINHLSYKR